MVRKQLQSHLEKRAQQSVSNARQSDHSCQKIEKKIECLARRSGEIVKTKVVGSIISLGEEKEDLRSVQYNAHFQYLIKQKGRFHLEEEIETRSAEFYKGILIEDKEVHPFNNSPEEEEPREDGEEESLERVTYQYNRLKAVQYAERWWNSYNPAYEKFEVDCTNYISQCLHAGGAPMRGFSNRSKGWWMRNNNWSYSWSVANALRWYLPGSTVGLRAKEVKSPEELLLGDVICYDFQGDGRFDHNTIVTAKDVDGMPLVNAHTYNSRNRYWAYEDSTAYTLNIKYKFFSIVDDE